MLTIGSHVLIVTDESTYEGRVVSGVDIWTDCHTLERGAEIDPDDAFVVLCDDDATLYRIAGWLVTDMTVDQSRRFAA